MKPAKLIHGYVLAVRQIIKLYNHKFEKEYYCNFKSKNEANSVIKHYITRYSARKDIRDIQKWIAIQDFERLKDTVLGFIFDEHSNRTKDIKDCDMSKWIKSYIDKRKLIPLR